MCNSVQDKADRRFALGKLFLAVSGVLLGTATFGAHAQDAPAEDSSDLQKLEEVVVTGTLIRGIEPTGSQVIGITAEDVKISGAVDSNALLATVPQVTNLFNERTTINPAGTASIQIVRPNLRSLPSGNTATGASTLVLLDGHRLPPVGVGQSAPDSDMIPPGMVERVELVTDGGSAIYGSDAIGGVINFVTRRQVDGVELSGAYGVADDYDQYDTNLTAGKEWDTGSVYGSYSYADRGQLLVEDRGWAKSFNYTDQVDSETRCTPANVSADGVNYAMPNLQPGTTNYCDPTQESSLSPKQTRQNFFAGYSQDIGDTLVFDIKGFYSERKVTVRRPPSLGLVTINSANPYYMDVNGQDSIQSVSFDFSPYNGDSAGDAETEFKAWNIAPELKFEFADDWVLRTLMVYGHSETTFNQPEVNSTLLSEYGNGTTFEDAINPYSIGNTQNKQLLADILNWQQVGESEADLFDARAIVDGPVYQLPTGEVRIAIGAEYVDEKFKQRQGFTQYGGEGELLWGDANRDVTSAFAELQVPLVGESNNIPWVEYLGVSLAIRYDDYSDFGSTTNPKYGINYNPVEWVTLRGSWGKSFNAPSLVDLLNSSQSTSSVFSYVPIRPPGVDIPRGSWALALQGARPGLQPQEATTWSYGFDVSPPSLPGLQATANYYYIEFEGALGRPPVFDPPIFFSNPAYDQFYILNPTDEQIAAAAATTINPEVADVLLEPGAPYTFEIIDFRTTNLSNNKIKGLDASVTYVTDVEFGTLDFLVGGNYLIQSRRQLSDGAPYVSELDFQPTSFIRASAGLTRGNFRSRATVNYRDSYPLPVSPSISQDHVQDFTVVDLFFGYDLQGSGWRENLSVTLNIQNVLDQNPPEFRSDNGTGYSNGFTIGRMFQVGMSKRF